MATTQITSDFHQQLLKDSALEKLFRTETTQKPILPLGGFVIKSRVVTVLKHKSTPKLMDLKKFFINVCYSDRLPINDMVNYQEKINSGTFKLPISLSPLRTDIDKQGSLCYVVDAAINNIPYNLTITDPDFKQFIVDLCIAWVAEKHHCELGAPSLPKMVCKGKLVPHMINRPLRPTIEVVEEDSIKSNDKTELTAKIKPSYTVVKEPRINPKYLTVKIILPDEENIDEMELDLEEDCDRSRLIFNSKYYTLEFDFDVRVDLDSVGNL